MLGFKPDSQAYDEGSIPFTRSTLFSFEIGCFFR